MTAHGRTYAFLRGTGRNGCGRLLTDVLAFDDTRIEAVHDFSSVAVPAEEPSRVGPGARVLTPAEAAAIRDEPQAHAGLKAGLERMTRFYADIEGWLTGFDHDALRITRIITATRDLLGPVPATIYHIGIGARTAAAGAPRNGAGLRYRQQALN